MSAPTDGLFWMPYPKDFNEALRRINQTSDSIQSRMQAFHALSLHNLDFLQTVSVYRHLQTLLEGSAQTSRPFPCVKIALLSSTTIDHLLPSMTVGAFRRGLLVEWFIAPYNQIRQEILNPSSRLYEFKPDIVLLLLHASEVGISLTPYASTSDVNDAIQQRISEWSGWWDLMQRKTDAAIVQSTMVIPPQQLFGHLDATIPAAPTSLLTGTNLALQKAAAAKSVHLLDLDGLASRVGKFVWCASALWYHAKQDIPLAHAPLMGDYVGRLVASLRGLSRKCLVVDLDGTLWGGIIGDDGLDHIEIGPGSGVGEAFAAFQSYLKELQARGVLLAACSKNEEANAFLPFDKHPDMVLRRKDFTLMIANWQDKVTNIKHIAAALNIGLDAIVFFDNDPAERQLVRELLPTVAVPEVPEDPADFIICLSEGGYFEAGFFTPEDQHRTIQYQASQLLPKESSSESELTAFLDRLKMEIVITPFDDLGLPRVMQLTNKSNQFNLTTRRTTEASLHKLMKRPDVITFQVRLKDRLADHGMISVIIAEPSTQPSSKALCIDTWLMSCRVLGRHVEEEVLNHLVQQARRTGYHFLRGEYVPTEKNGIVKDHYKRLGFHPLTSSSNHPPSTWWELTLADYHPISTPIQSHFLERTPS
jgi:FkbH-like protein